jgi:hypothetical protein
VCDEGPQTSAFDSRVAAAAGAHCPAVSVRSAIAAVRHAAGVMAALPDTALVPLCHRLTTPTQFKRALAARANAEADAVAATPVSIHDELLLHTLGMCSLRIAVRAVAGHEWASSPPTFDCVVPDCASCATTLVALPILRLAHAVPFAVYVPDGAEAAPPAWIGKDDDALQRFVCGPSSASSSGAGAASAASSASPSKRARLGAAGPDGADAHASPTAAAAVPADQPTLSAMLPVGASVAESAELPAGVQPPHAADAAASGGNLGAVGGSVGRKTAAKQRGANKPASISTATVTGIAAGPTPAVRKSSRPPAKKVCFTPSGK